MAVFQGLSAPITQSPSQSMCTGSMVNKTSIHTWSLCDTNKFGQMLDNLSSPFHSGAWHSVCLAYKTGSKGLFSVETQELEIFHI